MAVKLSGFYLATGSFDESLMNLVETRRLGLILLLKIIGVFPANRSICIIFANVPSALARAAVDHIVATEDDIRVGRAFDKFHRQLSFV